MKGVDKILEGYRPRIVDARIEEDLKRCKAISIEGPRSCGKTFSGLKHAKSYVNLDDERYRKIAEISPNDVLTDEKPQLIDEWNRVPKIWDAVRMKCDQLSANGNYILTCSTHPSDDIWRTQIHHSGAGRFTKIYMRTMSLYESGESSGDVSLKGLFEGDFQTKAVKLPELKDISKYIVRGGWPMALNEDTETAGYAAIDYVNTIRDKDIHEFRTRDSGKIMPLLESLARNESTIAGVKTLVRDIYENDISTGNRKEMSRDTVEEYLSFLERLHVTDNIKPYNANYRSPERIGKTSVRHFCDPSLACALLKITPQKLLLDLNLFGLLFESMAIRDLKVYMDAMRGEVLHFRDNATGDEVDAILETRDGEYAAVEIKLADNLINEGKKSLIKFYNNVDKKPKFMAIIVGVGNIAYKDEETGIYVIPITVLKN